MTTRGVKLLKAETSFSTQVPSRGQNPIDEMAHMIPNMGKFGNRPPIVIPKMNPNFFSLPPIPNNQLGQIGGLISGGDPISATNFSGDEPNTDVTQWMSNYDLQYTRDAKEISRKFVDFMQPMMVIITRKNPEKVGSRVKQYIMVNIPGFNYIMAAQYDPKTMGTKDAVDIWQEWFVDGIVRTEEGHDELHYHQEKEKERRFNLYQKAETSTFNIWGNSIRKGTRLYLIFKQVKLPNTVKYDMSGTGQNTKIIKNEYPNEDFCPFQIVPWAHYKYDYPPSQELEYIDNNGITQTGVAIYIGTSNSDLSYNSTYLNDTFTDVTKSVASIVSRGKIEVFVDF
jgi:hypothetical protein